MWTAKPNMGILFTSGTDSPIPPRNHPAGIGCILAVFLFFFVSGACGLLYQVVWTRKLVLLFGTTAYAVSTVLSIFFIGLGAGSILGGRWADRARCPLFLYGLFELLIGIWALVFILTVGLGESALVGLLRGFTLSRGAGIALRAALAFAFLIVPVILMGATLPLLAKFVSGESQMRGLRIGSLYSLNTFGAVAGCGATGFLILPALGYTRASLFGAVANAVIGVLAMILSRFVPAAQPGPHPKPETRNPKPDLVLIAFAVSGFCALALEVLWTRLLTIVFIGTTYAFTTMLTTLLCGIAVGSAFASTFVDRIRRRVTLFGAVEMLIGIACILMLPVFAALPQKLSAMQLDAGYQWASLVRAKFYLSFSVLFAPTFLFGMTFPIVVKTITSSGARLGHDVGRLYSANTFGGMFGALAGGFLLIPFLGTHRGLLALSLVLFGVGLVLLLSTRELRAWLKLPVAAAACLLLFLSLKQAPDDVGQALNRGYIPENHKVLFYREGVEGTVAVSEPPENPGESDRILWINAVQATASIEKGVKMNRFQGILPLLFDRDPRTVLFMCFGSGITAGTLALYDFDRIDAVEISSDVLDAAHLFGRDNFDVLDDPIVRPIVDDGRNFLLTTPNAYDVITFEPMPLALAGVSTFYTREYYRLCLDHLAPGGIVSQWIPLHSLDPDVVRSLIHTFTSVFPEYCAWFVNADLFMVGSNQPLLIDPARVSLRLGRPEIRQAIQAVGFKDNVEVLTCFFMGKQHAELYAAEGDVMTDDRPWAEFMAPKLMFQRTVDKSLVQLSPFFESPSGHLSLAGISESEAASLRKALDLRHKARIINLQGLALYYGGAFGSEPEKFFKEALDIDPDDNNSRDYLKEITIARANTYVRWDEIDKAIACLSDAIEYAPDVPELYLTLGDVCFDHGRQDEARACYQRYLALGGKDPRAVERSSAR